jgi:hypothetical protein
MLYKLSNYNPIQNQQRAVGERELVVERALYGGSLQGQNGLDGYLDGMMKFDYARLARFSKSEDSDPAESRRQLVGDPISPSRLARAA